MIAASRSAGRCFERRLGVRWLLLRQVAGVRPLARGDLVAGAGPDAHHERAPRVRGAGVGGGDAVGRQEPRERCVGVPEPVRGVRVAGAGGVDHRHARHRHGARGIAARRAPARRDTLAHDDDFAHFVAGVAADDIATGRRPEPARVLPLDEAEAAVFGDR